MESNISKAEVFFKDLSLEIKSLFIQFIKKIFTEKFLEIKYFNTENTTEEELNKIIEFIINKNSVKSYKGDLSTNSLIKFYHYILKDKEENIDNKIFEKNKQDFISIFEKNFEDFINKENKNNKIEKYEINNHYINIFLKDKTILEDSENSDKINNIKDNDSFIFNSIGTLISCFPEKFSSPRQGNLLELTRAKIVLKKNIDMHSFDGIENFTYIWIIYVFHLNQNLYGLYMYFI